MSETGQFELREDGYFWWVAAPEGIEPVPYESVARERDDDSWWDPDFGKDVVPDR